MLADALQTPRPVSHNGVPCPALLQLIRMGSGHHVCLCGCVACTGGASPADPGDSAVYLDDPPHPTDTHPQHTHNHDHKAAHQAEASDGDTQPPTPVSSSHHQQHPHKLPPLTFNRSSGWSRLPGPELQPMQAQVSGLLTLQWSYTLLVVRCRWLVVICQDSVRKALKCDLRARVSSFHMPLLLLCDEQEDL